MIKNIAIGSTNAIRAYLGASLIWDRWPLSQLFSAGQQGAIYDPSDLSTLWQDAAGTVPVTKSGDPVGLMLDKSLGLALGAELIINGDFDTIDAWNTTLPANVTFNVLNNVAQLKVIAGYGGVTIGVDQTISTVIGKTYKITARVTHSGASAAGIGVITTNYPISIVKNVSTPTTIQLIFTAVSTSTTMRFGIQGDGENVGDTATLTNVSMREIKGNHAKQSLSAARPLSQTDGTKSWIYNDKVDDKLLVTLPAMTATVVTVTDDGVTINYPVSIAAGNRDITSTSTLGRDYGRLIIDRELTADEKAQVTTYFNAKRGV